jgi:hypothetical protein
MKKGRPTAEKCESKIKKEESKAKVKEEILKGGGKYVSNCGKTVTDE